MLMLEIMLMSVDCTLDRNHVEHIVCAPDDCKEQGSFCNGIGDYRLTAGKET